MKLLLLSLALTSPALACGPDHACACSKTASAEADRVRVVAAEKTLLGSACPHATKALVDQVLDTGTPWTYSGSLRAQDAAESVATPFVAGPDAVKVLANAILEDWVKTTAADPSTRPTFQGRRLDLDGTTYFVVTDYTESSS